MGGGTLTEAGAMRRPNSRWINWGGEILGDPNLMDSLLDRP